MTRKLLLVEMLGLKNMSFFRYPSSSSNIGYNEKQLIQFQVESPKFDNTMNDANVHLAIEGDVHQAVEVHPKETTNPKVEDVRSTAIEGVHPKMAPQGTNTKIILQDYILSKNKSKRLDHLKYLHALISLHAHFKLLKSLLVQYQRAFQK